MCKAIPKNIALRLYRACSERVEYLVAWRKWSTFFARRGYDSHFVDKMFRTVSKLDRRGTLTPRGPRQFRDGQIQFIVPFAPNTAHIGETLQSVSAQSMARSMYRPRGLRLPQRPTYQVGARLQQLLVRSAFTSNPGATLAHGCWKCNAPDCRIDAHIREDKVVFVENSSEVFDIRQRLTCNSKHVIYVVRCRRCNVIGVGECENPLTRLPKYLYAAAAPLSRPTSAVELHFTESLHSPCDVEFMLIDSVPFRFRSVPAILPAIRTRLEEIWIGRLRASLNVKRQTRFSFTGFEGARRLPCLDE